MPALRRPRAAALALVVAGLGLSGAIAGGYQAHGLVEVTAGPPRWQASTTLEVPSSTVAAVSPTSLGPPDVATAPFSAFFDGVLRVRAVEPGALGVGTAFVVGDGHWALTNEHVVADASRIELETWDGRSAGTATHVGTAPGGQDLALLRLDDGLQPALRLRTERPASSEPVVTAGYPAGRWLTREAGEVQGRARSGGNIVLVTDLACEPGCSGSPVFDTQARVVGVIVGGTSIGQTLAIPIEDASALLRANHVLH
ncbi:MAG: hypothetical protein GEV08_15590 [Acidimicrobiia bacterium]|nr:hypothetical protein [Acidimicrobiia bacterium]